MAGREQISGRETGLMIIGGVGATAALFLPRALFEIARQDAWFVPLATTVYAWLVVAVVGALHKRHPGKSPVEICEVVFGRSGRCVLGLLYGLYFMSLLAITTREFGEFFIFAALPRTPTIVITSAVLFVTVVAVRNGVENFTRLVPMLTILILFAVFFNVVLTVQELDLGLLLPVLRTPFRQLMLGVLETSIFYGQVIAIGWYLPHMARQRGDVRWLYAGVLLLSVIMVFLFVGVIGVYGAEVAGNLSAPIFGLAREARVGAFAERLDALFLSAWQIGFFMKFAFLLYPMTRCFAEAFNLKDYRPLVIPLAILNLSLAASMFDSLREIGSFARTTAIPYALVFQLLLPLALLGVLVVSGSRSAESGGQTRKASGRKPR